MVDSKKGKDEEKTTTSSISDRQKQEVERPLWWLRGLIIDPESGNTIWPRYSFPHSHDYIQSLIANRQEAIDYALKKVPEEIRNETEQSLHHAQKSQYYQNIAWGNKPGAEASREFLGNAIIAAKNILRRMLKDWKNGYDYAQRDMLSIITDNIREFESVLEAHRKQKFYTDISAEVRHVVTRIASFKGKGIANNDEIGLILLAAGLFHRIRCEYNEAIKLKPQITKKGLKIEKIPYDEWPQDLRPHKTKCQHIDIVPDHKPACNYPRIGYCKKATDKVQRILSVSR